MPFIRNHQYYRPLIRILAGGLLVLGLISCVPDKESVKR